MCAGKKGCARQDDGQEKFKEGRGDGAKEETGRENAGEEGGQRA
jgi:hypothetical protein